MKMMKLVTKGCEDKLCLVAKKGDHTKDGSSRPKKNYCFTTKEGSINIVKQVKLMIQSNNYSMHDCEPYLKKVNQTCVDVLTYYKKSLHEKNIAIQELYHLRVRLEEKKLKVTILEAYLKLEKHVRLLSETQLYVAFNQ